MPAAGVGSRLHAGMPKFLVPVAGRPMIDWLLDLYRDHVDRVIFVVGSGHIEEARARSRRELPVDAAVQDSPTGMLDAVLIAREYVEPRDVARVWVTWCDQIAVLPSTVERLAALSDERPRAPLIMPTVMKREPYIHFERDVEGRIHRVLHRREGDAMPDVGEGDAGLFSFSPSAFGDELPVYAESVRQGAATGERNLLPFIPWIARTADVLTFPCEPIEAVGINTPDELRLVEASLLARGGA